MTKRAEAQVAEPESIASARAAGLRYTSDHQPGLRRQKAGKHFRYLLPNGKSVREAETLQRIRSLAIPPAWTHVWICAAANGHLQATGRDAKGRKQYRYHPRWRAVRDDSKYERMLTFAKVLPKLRRRIRRDLRLSGLSKDKVLAAVVQLLECTLIRVGNEEYARENHSFGLTTMLDRHVDVHGRKMRFHFRGKSGIRHEINLADRRLARIVKSCRDLPGQELFQYVDDRGSPRDIDSGDVNEYLQRCTGHDFTAKDFRTWAGTVLAVEALRECHECQTKTQTKRNLVRAVERVAQKLGNTSSVCRKCYIHPEVLGSYLDGSFARLLKECGEHHGSARFKSAEWRTLEFLGKRLEWQGRRSTGKPSSSAGQPAKAGKSKLARAG